MQEQQANFETDRYRFLPNIYLLNIHDHVRRKAFTATKSDKSSQGISLMMDTEKVSETLYFCSVFTRLNARKDVIIHIISFETQLTLHKLCSCESIIK
jgi:hypothetical protein